MMQAGSGKRPCAQEIGIYVTHSLLPLPSGVVGSNTEKLLTYHHFHLYCPPLLSCARRWIREPAPRSPSQHLCAGTGTGLPSSPVGKVWGNGYNRPEGQCFFIILVTFQLFFTSECTEPFLFGLHQDIRNQTTFFFFSLKKEKKRK